jgi:hypothetical protein
MVRDDEELTILENMEKLDFVMPTRGGYQLTKVGVRSIRCSVSLSCGVQVLGVREQVAIPDLSVFEKILMLLDDGWQW